MKDVISSMALFNFGLMLMFCKDARCDGGGGVWAPD